VIDVTLDLLSWILLALGGACVLIGGVGGLRLPGFYTRIHAASLTDTMATILIFVGMMLQSGLSLATMKLLAIMLFQQQTGPTATYSQAKAALLSGLKPDAGKVPDKHQENAGV
jgi:multicomponent Na+:H+ antiporter subunit G